MKVTFFSNFLTHHQVPFCLEMQKRLGDDFKFVSTQKIFQWRLDMGFQDLDKQYDFVVRAYENEEMEKKAKELALDSDIVMIGSIPDDYIEERLKQDKITFRYRYRIFLFTDGFWKTVFNKEKLKLLYQRHIKYRKNKNLYMLSANAYGANDFNRFGMYKNKIFKWGYFLENQECDIEKLIDKKETNEKIEIVWVARFIKWKHPEVALKLAKKLKKQGYNFELKMLGTGVLEEKIKNIIQKEHLEDVVEVIGQVPSTEVRKYMEKANIFIATSDSAEGWGAVVNEAMSAGCAVIANRRMGSAPYLIKQNKSGIMYNTYKELEEQVKRVIKDKALRKTLGMNAYEVVDKEWTSENAVNNLLKLFEATVKGKEIEIEDGPASKAKKYKYTKKI